MARYCDKCHYIALKEISEYGYAEYDLCHEQKHLSNIDTCVDSGIANFVEYINTFATTTMSCEGDLDNHYWYLRYPWLRFDDPVEYGKCARFVIDSQPDFRWGTLYDFSERATLHEADVLVRLIGTSHQMIFTRRLDSHGEWEPNSKL